MDERIAKLLEPIADRAGASEEAIARLRQYVGADLPSDFVEFLRWSNGAAGVMRAMGVLGEKLGGQGHYLLLSSAEEIPELTDITAPMHPGYLNIGSSGDSTFEVLIDTRSGNPQTMTFVQFDPYGDPSEDEAEKFEYRAGSFGDLLDHLSTAFADLTGVDLREADLRGAHLYYATLVEAELTGADLRGADLRVADLTNAKLKYACYNAHTRWPSGFEPERHGAVRK